MDEGARLTIDEGDDDLRRFLDERIHEFNEGATGITDGRFLTVRQLDATGEIVGAATGWTFGGCGYVDVLWVREDARHDGVGTRLLDAFEAESHARGCTQVALSTHSFQAPAFYAARGYVEVGRTPDYPRGHDHVHLLKRLAP
jgi:GNAT superfamily N-acetyltransferase